MEQPNTQNCNNNTCVDFVVVVRHSLKIAMAARLALLVVSASALALARDTPAPAWSLAARLALLVASASTAQALDNGVGRTPALGWSTWNTFGGSVSDELLRASADVMVSSGLRDAGYEYINLDDVRTEVSCRVRASFSLCLAKGCASNILPLKPALISGN